MCIKIAFILLFSVFTTFSTENENDEESVLQLLKKELEQRLEKLEKLVESFQKGEKSVIFANKLLEARQENLERREQSVADMEMGLKAKEDRLEDRERDLGAREETLKVREKSLQVREENLKQMETSLHADVQQLIEESIQLNDANIHECEKPKEKLKLTSKILEILNLFPSESYWEDSADFIRNDCPKKRNIESSRQNRANKELKVNYIVPAKLEKDQTLNCLFACIFDYWFDVPAEVHRLIKNILFSISGIVDVDRVTATNYTPLMFSARFGTEQTVAKLIDRGANVEAFDDDYECTALHFATWKGSKSSCKILLLKGANVNAQDVDGWTPLMMAAQYNREKVVKLLLEFGAHTKIFNKCGDTALNYATGNCAKLIEAHVKCPYEAKWRNKNEKI